MILFYGCWSDSGHFMYNRHGATPRWNKREGGVTDRFEAVVPWGFRVDGHLAPRTGGGGEAPNGVAGFHQNVAWVSCPGEEVWSALSWWDNSVDKRGGSCATFLADRRCTPSELLTEAQEAFPQIFARFKYAIILPVYS